MPIIYAQYLYWYWYLKVMYWYLYWYLDHWYWYWYWYLFVEYLIQDWYVGLRSIRSSRSPRIGFDRSLYLCGFESQRISIRTLHTFSRDWLIYSGGCWEVHVAPGRTNDK